jgi:hypothetical protein
VPIDFASEANWDSVLSFGKLLLGDEVRCRMTGEARGIRGLHGVRHTGERSATGLRAATGQMPPIRP